MRIGLPISAISALLKTASFLAAQISPLFVDRKKVDVIQNIEYRPAQFLDVYRPRNFRVNQELGDAKLPISIFIHGGGFSYFSKESHAAAAAILAENGFLVFSINYRLAPKFPFPAGLTDAIDAYDYIQNVAESYGGDLERISLIGESAGANFSLCLCLHLFQVRALDSSDTLPPIPKYKPKSAIIHCGHLQVTNVLRYLNDPRSFPEALLRLKQIQEYYLPESLNGPKEQDWGLANPLVVLENLADAGQSLPLGFPEIFVPVGSIDPVIGDSERLGKALERLGQKDRLKVYPNETHAFYAFPFRKASKQFWRDVVEFLRRF